MASRFVSQVKRPEILDDRITIMRVGEDEFVARWQHLNFIVSQAMEFDGKYWLHVSLSRLEGSVSCYEDMRTAKEMCIGTDRTW